MALEDLVQGKDIPKPINSSNLINQGKDVSSLNSPSGRHLKSPVNIPTIDNLAGEGIGGLEQSKTQEVPIYTNPGLANSKKK